MATIAVKLIAIATFFGIALAVRNNIRKNRSKYIKEEIKQEDEVKPFDFENYPSSENDGLDKENSDFNTKGKDNGQNDPFV